MAFKHNDSCLLKADDDEPIFVLRAQDRTAPAVVRNWILRQLAPDQSATIFSERVAANPKLAEARDLADKMEAWQRAHADRVKMPD